MDDFIIEIKNAYPDELCDEFIHEWVTPKEHLMSKYHPDLPMDIHLKMKSSQDIQFQLHSEGNIVPNPRHLLLNDKYQYIMTKVKKKYTDILIENGLDRRSSTPPEVYMLQEQITDSIQSGLVMARTDPGQHYDWHVDSTFGDLCRERLLTCILYLNDMDEDAGGCTEFSNGRVVRPEKGKVLIFPATPQYVYRGAIVNKGTKYEITTFAREPVYNGGLPFIVKPDKH
jgi:hypothetical protein